MGQINDMLIIDDTCRTYVVDNNGEGGEVVSLVGRNGVEARVETSILGRARSSK